MTLFKPESDPMHKRVIEFMDRVADEHKFRYSLDESLANRDLLIAVWEMCQITAATQSRENLDRLRGLAYELVWASKMGEMMKCYHKEPTPEDMERIQILFQYPLNRLDYEDVVWTNVPRVFVDVEYTIETDNEDVLKLQPNVQLKLFDEEDV